MAIKNKYVLEFSSKGVNKTKRSVDKLETSQRKLVTSSTAVKVGFIAAGAAVVAAGGYAVKVASQFEQLKTRLNTMYGSVAAGEKAFAKFNQVAATTPFALASVVEAGASLKAFGVDAEKNIKPVADLAAFMGLDVVEAASAMGRAFAGGAGAADILRERGVLQLIKDFKGVDDLTKLTLPEFRKALEEAMIDPTLGIAGATDALSKTFSGAYSNMMDSVDRLAAGIGDLLLPVLKDATKFIGGLADSINGGLSAYDEQIQKLEMSQIHVGRLVELLQDADTETKDYKDALKLLKSEYPDFIQGLEDEELALADINKLKEDYLDLTNQQIKQVNLQIQREAFQEQYKEIIQGTRAAEIAIVKSISLLDDQMRGMRESKYIQALEPEVKQALSQIEASVIQVQQKLASGLIDPEQAYQQLVPLGEAWEEITDNAVGFFGQGTSQVDFYAKFMKDIMNNLEDDFKEFSKYADPSQDDFTTYILNQIKLIDEEMQNLSINDPTDPLAKGATKNLTFIEKFMKGYNKLLTRANTTHSELVNSVVSATLSVAAAGTDGDINVLKVQRAVMQGEIAAGIISAVRAAMGKGPLAAAKAAAEIAGLTAQGVTQTGAINKQISEIRKSKSELESASGGQVKFAQYGMNEVVDSATPIVAGEAGAELVQITPLEGANLDGPQGGGNIIITGNVLSRDFVQNELIDELREAIRQGYDFR